MEEGADQLRVEISCYLLRVGGVEWHVYDVESGEVGGQPHQPLDVSNGFLVDVVEHDLVLPSDRPELVLLRGGDGLQEGVNGARRVLALFAGQYECHAVVEFQDVCVRELRHEFLRPGEARPVRVRQDVGVVVSVDEVPLFVQQDESGNGLDACEHRERESELLLEIQSHPGHGLVVLEEGGVAVVAAREDDLEVLVSRFQFAVDLDEGLCQFGAGGAPESGEVDAQLLSEQLRIVFQHP